MLLILYFSLLLLVSKDALALLSLLQPPLSSARVNSTQLPNGTLSRAAKEPFRLLNLFVFPPVAVNFTGYGDYIPRAIADVCLYEALDYALSTRDHSSVARIDASDLDYTNSHVSLNFHRDGVVIWEEWKNALYLILEFVDRFDTREFFFVVEIKDDEDWWTVGKGYLIKF